MLVTDFYFETNSKSIALIDSVSKKFLKLSFFRGSDRSGYLSINSGNSSNPDYLKLAYHPRINEFKYEFTNEFWAKQGRPNKERKLYSAKPNNPNQLLAEIYIDRSALFRQADKEDLELSDSLLPFHLEHSPAVRVGFGFEEGVCTLTARGISEVPQVRELIDKDKDRIYEEYPDLDKKPSGCVQAMLSGKILPLRIVVFGI